MIVKYYLESDKFTYKLRTVEEWAKDKSNLSFVES